MKQFHLSGIIGWDVTAEDLHTFFDDAGGGDVEVVVSSPGGLVGQALAMFNMIRNYSGKVTAVLSGYAMSAASYIPLAADEIEVEDNAVYMIHNVHGGVFGDHNYILKYGRETKALSRLIATAYARRTGMALDDIRAMMDDETYFYGEEIVDKGFADLVRSVDGDASRDDALTMARQAFKECSRRMTMEYDAAADDWMQAVAMAGDMSHEMQDKNGNRAATPAEKRMTEENSMDLKTLKEKYPDLVAALEDEFMTGLDLETMTASRSDLIDEAMLNGAENERNRIADVRAQLIPGHEDLVARMELDGKSTGADAAKAIVAAEKALRVEAGNRMHEEANEPVPSTDGSDGVGDRKMKRKDFNSLSFDAQRSFVQAGGVIIDD